MPLLPPPASPPSRRRARLCTCSRARRASSSAWTAASRARSACSSPTAVCKAHTCAAKASSARRQSVQRQVPLPLHANGQQSPKMWVSPCVRASVLTIALPMARQNYSQFTHLDLLATRDPSLRHKLYTISRDSKLCAGELVRITRLTTGLPLLPRSSPPRPVTQ